MAQLAIPVLVLGGLYIMSNQEKQEKQEHFENMKQAYKLQNKNKKKHNQQIVQCKPNKSSLSNNNKQNINEFDGRHDPKANLLSKKYYKNNLRQLEKNESHISLTGEQIKAKDFKHTNMQPFFGGKIRGSGADSHVYEGLLDTKQGTGSQLQRKKEVSSFFNQKDGFTNMHGTPNYNDFYQSRVQPSLKHEGIKPWQEEKVNISSGFEHMAKDGMTGFNSGMYALSSDIHKNVDDTRVITNPKSNYSFDREQGPGHYGIKSMGNIGKVEKHSVDTFFHNNPDRWFSATTQDHMAFTSREHQGIKGEKQTHMEQTNGPYIGQQSVMNGDRAYVKGKYIPSSKQQLGQIPVSGIQTDKINPNILSHDHGKNSYDLGKTNRSESDYSSFGGMTGLVKAITAPVLDVLRSNKKEELMLKESPSRMLTQPSAPGLGKVGTYRDTSRAPDSTLREITEDRISMNYLQFQNQDDMNARVPENYILGTKQESTLGFYSGSSSGNQSYGSDNNRNLNAYELRVNKTAEIPHMGHGSGNDYYSGSEVRLSHDQTESSRSFGNPNATFVISPTIEAHGVNSNPTTYSLSEMDQSNRLDGNVLTAFMKNPYTR